ncbi:MAG: hypothetical protein RIS52_2226 [Pseudomonadota bacterium]|jgi:ElaB/YqjD/DUF883 family membrane-anchored ribosome-binding protein
MATTKAKTSAAPLVKKATPAKPAVKKAKAAKPAPEPDTLREQAANFSAQAKDKMRTAATTGKDKASEAIGGVSAMVDDVATSLDEKFGAQYGDYARKAASAVSGFAETLQSKDVDDLVTDAREFVRKRPAVAIGAAAAVGFVLTRLLKAGTDDAE